MRLVRARRHATVTTGLLVMGFAIPVQSKPLDTWLTIDRLPGSEQCPNAGAVFAALARLFPDTRFESKADPKDAVVSAHVTIQTTLEGHVAFIEVILPRPGERTLAVKNDSCRGLDEALAVTLALLLDPERDDVAAVTSSTETTKPNLPPPIPLVTPSKAVVSELRLRPPPRTESPSHRSPSAHFLGFIRVGGFAGLGVLSRPSAGPSVGLRLEHTSGLGLTAEGLRLWSSPANRDGGNVHVSLWGLLAEPCYRRRLGPDWRTGACLFVGLGEQRASSAGYGQDGAAKRPWAVFGSALSVTRQLDASLSSSLSIGYLGHLMSQGFTVKNVGTVADPPSIGAFLQLGLEFGGGIF